jgi:glycolate dehydrogenase FAD-binding subunit
MTDITCSSEAEVVDAVRAARDWKSPLNIVGARTKRGYGRAMAQWGTVLDLSGLTGVVSYEPDEMILTVRPGTKVTEIAALLAAENQCLGFDPPDWGPLFGAGVGQGTIGGAIAADVAGARAVRYGRVRDHLLGFRAVNGLGEAYKAGGKVVKNVTGFDLSKLMCGSFGTLGPLTEVTLRVFPKAEKSRVFVLTGLNKDDGLALLRRVWSAPLDASGLALLSYEAVRHFPEIALPPEDDAGGEDEEDDFRDNDGCVACLRLEGSDAALAEKISLLRALVPDRELVEIADGAAAFRRIDAATGFVDTMEDVWLLQIPPAAAGDIVRTMTGVWIADFAGARIWERGTPGYAGDWHREKAANASGSATLVRASDATRAHVAPFAPEPPERAALTRAVKAAFDPLGLFNPGRMWEGV